MASPQFPDIRKALLEGVEGDVLEIGFGTGLNLPHYPPAVRKLTAIDKNPGMAAKAEQRISDSSIEVEHLLLNGETLPMADGSYDCVVSGWTLCSIRNVGQALQEIHRVLKPAGRFFFAEHGLSPDITVRKWQNRLNPVQKFVADGCNLNRDIKGLIESHGFTITKLREFYMHKIPKPHGYMYQGVASK